MNLFCGTAASAGELAETRWGGARFADRVEEEAVVPCSRQVVEWAMDTLSLFEPGLASVAGVKTIADYLDPVACDWEELRPVAAKTGFLSTNDTALSSNLGAGAAWLAQHWSGAGAQSLAEAAAGFRQQADERADHMRQVASALRRGGESLEQLAKNQAAGLVADLMRPTTFHGFTMPLGHWGALLGHDMPADVRAAIESGVASAKGAAQARHDQIVSTLDNVKAALASVRGSLSDNAASWSPEALNLDYGTGFYSYESNIVREVSLVSPA